MGDPNPSFGFRVGLAFLRALPYLNDGGPQSQFFEAATHGDVSRLRGEHGGWSRLAAAGPVLAFSWACVLAMSNFAPSRASCSKKKELASGEDAEGKARLADDISFSGIGPLQAAARLGEVDACRCMVEELGFDINAGRELGHDEVERLLLSRGASVDIAYFHGTPLHIAAAYGKASVMKVLLEHDADAGADINFSDRDTPLVVAITNGLTNCIKYLLKAGADPNIPTCHCGALPIQLAASYGRRKDVELLFPLTSPIRAVSNWTVEGILAHAKSKHARSKCSKPKDKQDDHNKKAQFKLRGEKAIKDKHDEQDKKAQLKLQGEKAVKRKDYHGASIFYTEVR
uniref:Ankyrin n=1 Tax=Oryza sativa subsp. japonica TaxID=39947 RepID=Q9AUM7_ORYSJ|nr:putative ankyrin [Oryza sativa Japonica Group]